VGGTVYFLASATSASEQKQLSMPQDPPATSHPLSLRGSSDEAWLRVRELHRDLVGLEQELASLRAQSQRGCRARARRAPHAASDRVRRFGHVLRAAAARLPESVKSSLRPGLRAVERLKPNPMQTAVVPRFRESAVAHQYLDGLAGIEIGGSVHNAFCIAGCLNTDFTDRSAELADDQMRAYGEATRVDIVCLGDDLPFPDGSLDYVLSSHVIEHFYDPIGTLQEWQRVVRSGGYLFMIVPHRDRTFDRDRELTSIPELQDRHTLRQLGLNPDEPDDTREAHRSVWTTESFLELCATLDLRVVHVDDVDDKVGNGFTVVVQR
jgi:hypothetical protein